MNNSQQNEQDDLQKYLEEKAKQEQEQEEKEEQEPEPLSAYDACVLKESAKIHELIAEAKKRPKDE
ncbi:hypothetical protein [Psychrobacter sp. JCM 18900]|uniref:hypothetical protein n=1 Tax=Psychrobacter sp. JCM 18900 TaxID=1298608 RepID=UPI000432C590|nr:hypothetical protein [Psychrobacter sp. JCM 18900]GAF51860.1 hypothetical protein JCM18900_344 [Psychrobacter sp. JCM 18900]